MDNILTIIVNFASPAPLRAFGNVKLNGQTGNAATAKQRSTVTAISVATAESEKTATKRGATANKRILHVQSPIYASFNKRLASLTASSLSPAPISCPTITTSASLWTFPEYWGNL